MYFGYIYEQHRTTTCVFFFVYQVQKVFAETQSHLLFDTFYNVWGQKISSHDGAMLLIFMLRKKN